jgi:RNA binding exosome subunit
MGVKLHSACLRVFSKEGEDFESIKNAFLKFFPFNLEDEKIELKRHTAEGFRDKKIIILEATLTKQRHLKAFLNTMLNRLTKKQKKLLIRQKESRLDEDCEFFIRFDKDSLLKEGKYLITDSGNCFHLKLSIAAFPAKREIALSVIDEIFK